MTTKKQVEEIFIKAGLDPETDETAAQMVQQIVSLIAKAEVDLLKSLLLVGHSEDKQTLLNNIAYRLDQLKEGQQ